jgi:hypothetical protein
MRSALKIVGIVFLISCLIAGGGTVYLRMVNEPTEFLSPAGNFDLPYAIAWFAFGALYLGIRLFLVVALLVAVGFLATRGFRRLTRIGRTSQVSGRNDVTPPQ